MNFCKAQKMNLQGPDRDMFVKTTKAQDSKKEFSNEDAMKLMREELKDSMPEKELDNFMGELNAMCEYLEIEPYGESRIHKIMERVAYLFNNVGLDKESQLDLGDIKFQVKGRVEEGRINKTNYISIVTIPIETKYINSRTIDGSIGY